MKRTIWLVVCTLFMVVMMSGVALSAEEKAAELGEGVMISGTINYSKQLVDNEGQIFGIASTKEGNDLVTHAGEKVQVKGTVLESEGEEKLIEVLSYEVIKE
jgi:hypothetical protein